LRGGNVKVDWEVFLSAHQKIESISVQNQMTVAEAFVHPSQKLRQLFIRLEQSTVAFCCQV
jgi:hypothetical protein